MNPSLSGVGVDGRLPLHCLIRNVLERYQTPLMMRMSSPWDVPRISRRVLGLDRAVVNFAFALQLCAFRYPRRLLAVGEGISPNVLRFIVAQLGMRAENLEGYAVREETWREHLAELRHIYGYQMFTGRCAWDLKVWLGNEAQAARSNEGLARQFVEECQRRQVILPGLSVLERVRAGALVAVERRMETRLASGLDDAMPMRLDRLLTLAAYRGSRRRREPVLGGPELGRHPGTGEPILAALRAIGGGSRDMPRTFRCRNSCAAGLTVGPDLLAYISPFWSAHILLTDVYRSPKRR